MPLAGSGAAAYLDAAQLIALAQTHGCDAVHPGYGFISENAGFARACAAAGLCFVGPQPDVLDLFGDKAQARRFAGAHGVPMVAGTDHATSLPEATAFLAGLGSGGAIMIKAISGGGGRGMRPVTEAADLPTAFARCQAEALSAFGNGDVYVEQLFLRPRHIEIQILGDGTGAVAHLWERECSVQRARQKIIEIAPAPFLRPAVRDRLLGRPGGDWDLATALLPEAVMERAAAAGLRAIPTGLQHGTVTLMEAGVSFEITTFRGDGDYLDGRRASEIPPRP